MARYREYKNGIFGHKYRGLYIIRGEKNEFSIINENKEVVRQKVLDYDECEWEIDKLVASEDELKSMMFLYEKEIIHLSVMISELLKLKTEKKLNKNQKELLEMVIKIRKRKIEDRPFR